MTLTKAILAESLFNEVGLNKREAKELVELYFEEIKKSLEAGHTVKLSRSYKDKLKHFGG